MRESLAWTTPHECMNRRHHGETDGSDGRLHEEPDEIVVPPSMIVPFAPQIGWSSPLKVQFLQIDTAHEINRHR